MSPGKHSESSVEVGGWGGGEEPPVLPRAMWGPRCALFQRPKARLQHKGHVGSVSTLHRGALSGLSHSKVLMNPVKSPLCMPF